MKSLHWLSSLIFFLSCFSVGVTGAPVLVVSVQPSGAVGGTVFAQQPIVEVRESSNDARITATPYTINAIAQNDTSLLFGTVSITTSLGYANFTNLQLGRVGSSYRILFTSEPELTPIWSNNFNVVHGTMASLRVHVTPSGGLGGSPFLVQPVVSVHDVGGNIVSDVNFVVTASLLPPPGTANVLYGNVTAIIASGVANYTNLAIGPIGDGFVMVFTAGTLAPAFTKPLNISLGLGAEVVVIQQPVGATGGFPLAIQPRIEVRDNGGNVVVTSSISVTAVLLSPSGFDASQGNLFGNNMLTITGGYANFTNLGVNIAAIGYRFNFTSVLSSAQSNVFTITTGPAYQLLVELQPVGGVGLLPANLDTQPRVRIGDLGGNIIDGATNNVTVTLLKHNASGYGPATPFTGSHWLSAVNGHANFTDLGVPDGQFCSRNDFYLQFSTAGLAGVYSSLFSFTTGPTCTICPPGYTCSNGTATKVPCSAGTYSPLWGQHSQEQSCLACPPGTNSSMGSSNCTTCAAGTYCPGNLVAGGACSPGFYSLSGAASCTLCPAGKYCARTNEAPLPCPAGSVSLGGQTNCTFCQTTSASNCSDASAYYAPHQDQRCQICPAGYFCPNATVAVPCASGYYSLPGAAICTICPSGSWCPSPALAPVACAAGEYAASHNTTGCIPCPAGKYCTTPATQQICPAGSYSLAGQVSCTTCPAGYGCATAVGDTRVACDSGYYSLGGQTSCTGCQAGYACSNSSSLGSACPAGTYSLGNLATCNTCPEGSRCPVTNSGPIGCFEGQYSNAGSTVCQSCPLGSFCYGSSPPQLCPNGTYTDRPSSHCFECPSGSYCPYTWSTPILCPAGMYSYVNQSYCQSCPAGFYCPFKTNNTLLPCPSGTYSVGNQASCLPCPVGRDCTTGNSTGTPCPAGSFSGGGSACQPCTRGYHCPSAGSQPILCPLGSYSDPGAAICTLCPAGYQCAVPTDVPVPCVPGHYAIGNATACKACPIGMSCQITTSLPSPCVPGTFSLGSQTNCTSCPPAFSCPDTHTAATMTACTQGTYSAGGQKTCSTCPAGYACANRTNLGPPCAAGSYSVAGAGVCTVCPVGKTCFTNDVVPTLCPGGYYQTALGASNCTSCPAGYECPFPDRAPSPCSVGFFSGGGARTCSACENGYQCTFPATTATPAKDLCAKGGYCNPSWSFTPCPQGTYNSNTGGNAITSCIECPAGYFCPQETIDPTIGTSTICPAGYYCPSGTKYGLQHPCPGGTFNPTAGAQIVAQCIPCTPGYYCPPGVPAYNETTPISAVTCPPGHYCPMGTHNPRPCMAGTWSDTYSLTAQTQCRACTPGHYCEDGSTAPTPCPLGSYHNISYAVGVTQCQICTSGMQCNTVGMIEPVPCTLGNYCPGGTKNANDNPCNPGSWNPNSTSLAHQVDCTKCPARFACDGGTGAPGKPILACSVGHYCPMGTTYPTQHRCPRGSYTPLTNLSDASECEPCPAGSYCIGGQADVSGPCAKGHYCPQSTGDPLEFACPSGSWTNQIDRVSAADCEPCPPGHYCPIGSEEPTPCEAGSFRKVNGTVSQTMCNSCFGGYYCPSGTVDPVECGVGQFSDVGFGSCESCLAGHYCSNTSTSMTQMRGEQVCPPGAYCPPGVAVVPTPATHPCPIGSYCPSGASEPINCPEGTFNAVISMGYLANCTTCPAGYYCPRNSSSYTQHECSAGYYCPPGSKTATEYPCTAGTFGNTTMNTAQASCLDCPSGSFCPTGSATPTLCPPGFYCPSNSGMAIGCPISTYSNETGLVSAASCTLCDAGSFCDGVGLIEPRGFCHAGYYCPTGTSSKNPPLSRCPTGHYCPAGAATPTPCAHGTYNNRTLMQAETNCLVCKPGHFCNSTGNAEPTGRCSVGHWCGFGSPSPVPIDNIVGGICPAGMYCIQGATKPVECPAGMHQPDQGQGTCLTCPLGSFCSRTGLGNSTYCPSGHYCPEGSVAPVACHSGTYLPMVAAHNISQCLQCATGQYCATYGQGVTSGNCSAGYYCVSGAKTPTPRNLTNGDICPPGTYCPPGSGTPTHCPVGHYCTGGLGVPEICMAGTYQSMTNQTNCTSCPAGHHCPEGTSSLATLTCPQGHYCPEGTDDLAVVRCPVGTFSNVTGLVAVSDCYPCPPRMYCNETGLTAPSGFCPAGWHCIGSTATSNPVVISSTGGPCPAGTYCPAGSFMPTNCTAGQFCEGDKLAAPTGFCAAGYFCSSYGAASSTPANGLCPPGFYCPAAAYEPTPCPWGTFTPHTGNTNISGCTPCTAGTYCGGQGLSRPTANCSAGYYCPSGQLSGTPSSYMCSPGHYCPEGSVDMTIVPPGTYQDSPVQGNFIVCPTGRYCPYNMTTNYTQCTEGLGATAAFDCPVGHYCPEGSVAPLVCIAGQFQESSGQGSCLDCPSGYYCPHSSTLGEGTRKKIVCPTGHYCPINSVSPLQCVSGDFQDALAQSSCKICPGGSFCPYNQTHNETLGAYAAFDCPAGHKCPAATVTPEVCPVGYYQDLTGEVDCKLCPGGSYCAHSSLLWTGTTTAMSCPVGHKCTNGSTIPVVCPPKYYQDATGQTDCKLCGAGMYCPFNATVFTGTSIALNCPLGHYCPSGSIIPTVCDPGWYSNSTNQAACDPCPPGRYCPHSSVVHVGTPATIDCTVGMFCLNLSIAPTPCPSGTYQSLPAMAKCTTCPAGSYCPWNSTAGSFDVMDCPRGHHCPSGSVIPTVCNPSQYQDLVGEATCKPCPAGSYCSYSAQLWIGTYNATACPVGHYCVANRMSPQVCPTGQYQDTVGASACKPCPSGSYCPYSPVMYVGTPKALACPVGHFCTNSTITPTVCPPSQYQDISGKDTCKVCPAGSFCPYNGTLWGGTFTTFDCPLGHFCVNGSTSAVPCPPSTFQDSSTQASCKSCTAGSYCPTNGTVTPIPCPAAYYCPLSSASAFEHPCPPGSFSNAPGLAAASQCTVCPPSKYCLGGSTVVTGDCSAGFVCTLGAASATPTDGITGAVCPAGHYCPSASAAPTRCPAGTQSAALGLSQSSQCPPVPAGLFSGYSGVSRLGSLTCTSSTNCFPSCSNTTVMACANSSTSCPVVPDPSLFGPCSAGHKCTGGAVTSTPYQLATGDYCSPGTYCPAGSTTETACLPGTYNPDSNRGACSTCPVGFYCPAGATTPIVCPRGSFCTIGVSAPIPCPVGSFGNSTALESIHQCSACPQGHFCSSQGLTVPTGLCTAGYICYGGSGSASPAGGSGWLPNGAVPLNNICPQGHYCLTGSTAPVQCPAGKLTGTAGAAALTDCTPCPAGSYCATPGISTPTSVCDPGFYCPGSNTEPRPAGFECPAGSRCPLGSAFPIACDANWYQTANRSSACLPCPAGSHCPRPTEFPVPCPLHYFCEEGQPPVQCVDSVLGLWSNVTGLASKEECLPCPTGKYCRQGAVIGDCLAGYLCRGSARDPDPSGPCPPYPSDGGCNGPCPRGHYCEQGALLPTKCPASLFRVELGGINASDCGPCPAGFICQGDSAFPCPRGYHCPFGSEKVPCPIGSYQPDEGQGLLPCLPCIEGYWCRETNLSSVYGKECPEGHFCPGGVVVPNECPGGRYRDTSGAANVTDCHICPATKFCLNATISPQPCPSKFYCPTGTSVPRTCPNGFYCPSDRSEPIPCPSGMYCPVGSDNPLMCPLGAYCPPESGMPFLCPLGYVGLNMTVNRTDIPAACTPCPAGTHGTDPIRNVCDKCTAGYVCVGATTSATPAAQSQNGYVCPLGAYCPEGSATPTLCDIGTFQGAKGMVDNTACLPCPANSYNALRGQAECLPCGSSAFPNNASTACECKGENRMFQVSDGSCRCQLGYIVSAAVSGGAASSDPDTDGITDCEAVVLERCAGTLIRNAKGQCVDPADPTAVCGSSACLGGTELVLETVLMQESVGDVALCSCRCPRDAVDCIDGQTGEMSTSSKVTTDAFGNTVLTVTDKNTNVSQTFPLGEAGGLVGQVSCAAGEACNFLTMSSSDAGFGGVYDAPTSFFSNMVGNSTSAGATRRRSVSRRSLGRRQLLQSGAPVGITAPMMCLKAGQGILFEVATDSQGIDHFPQYNRDALYNTNPNFDYGAFMDLKRRVEAGEAVTSFYFGFDTPGVYAFADVSDVTQQSIVGVVDAALTCPPSFATNPVQPITAQNLKAFPEAAGGAVSLTLSPDYGLIVGMAVGLGIVMLVSGVGFYWLNQTGWGLNGGLAAHYKRYAVKGNLHAFAVPEADVLHGKRLEGPNAKQILPSSSRLTVAQTVTAEPLDLGCVDVDRVYLELSHQTKLVSEHISRQTDDVREFYDKLSKTSLEMRALVASGMDQSANAGALGPRAITSEDIVNANTRATNTISEMERRRQVGAAWARALETEASCENLPARNAFREAKKARHSALQMSTVKLDSEVGDLCLVVGNDAKRELSQLDTACKQVEKLLAEARAASETERIRRGVPEGFVGAGCVLVHPSMGGDVDDKVLKAPDGSIKQIANVTTVANGLVVPAPGVQLRRSDGVLIDAPPGWIVHPETCQAVPASGRVFVRADNGAIAFPSQLDQDELSNKMLPFVANPGSYPNVDAPYQHLVSDDEVALPFANTMTCPMTGLEVPVLAATLHSVSGQVLPVGGTHRDPITQMPIPIQIGALAEIRDQLFEIVGVTIDANGIVIPVGSCDSSGASQVIGSAFKDTASLIEGRVGWGRMLMTSDCADGTVVACENELFTAAQSAELRDEARVLDKVDGLVKTVRKLLQDCKQSKTGIANIATKARPEVKHLLQTLPSRLSKLAIRASQSDAVLTARHNQREEQAAVAERIAESGGAVGTMVDAVTGTTVPVLVGCLMWDRATCCQVPIVRVDPPPHPGASCLPLGGTVIDPITGLLESIRLGGRMPDMATGQALPITDVKRDPGSGTAIPVSRLLPRTDLPGMRDAPLMAAIVRSLQGATTPEELASALRDIGPLLARARAAADAAAAPRRAHGLADMSHDPSGGHGMAGSAAPRGMRARGPVARKRDDGPSTKELDSILAAQGVTAEQRVQMIREAEHSRGALDRLVSQEADSDAALLESLAADADTANNPLLGEKLRMLELVLEAERGRTEQVLAAQLTEGQKRKGARLASQQEAHQVLLDAAGGEELGAAGAAMAQLAEELDGEAEAEFKELDAKFAARRQELVAAEKARLAKEVIGREDISPDEVDAQMAKFNRVTRRLDNELARERLQQEEKLRAAHSAAKAKKMERLRQRQMEMQSVASAEREVERAVQERAEAEANAELEARDQTEAELAQVTASKNAELQAAKAAAEVALSSTSDETERNSILASLKASEERIMNDLEVERAKSQAALKDRIAEAKARRLAQMKSDLEARLKQEEAAEEQTAMVLAAQETRIETDALETHFTAARVEALAVKEKERDVALANVTTDEDKAAILAQYEAAVKQVDSQIVADKARQADELKAKLAAAREKRKAKIEEAQAQRREQATAAAEGKSTVSFAAIAAKAAAKKREEAHRLAVEAEETAKKEALEMETVASELEEKEKAALAAQLEEQRLALLDEEKEKRDNALSSAASEAERAEIMSKFESSMGKLDGYLQAEASRQEQALQTKLHEAKEKRQRRQAERAALKAREIELAAQHEEEVAKIALEQERQRKELQDAEHRAVEEEERAAQEQLEQEAENKRLQQEAERAAIEAEMLAAQQAEGAEMAAIVASAQAKIASLDSEVDAERQRQEAQMKSRLAAKRKQRQEALRNQQEAEMQRKVLEQEREAAAVAKQVEEVEQETHAQQVTLEMLQSEFAKKMEAEQSQFQAELQKAREEQARMREEMRKEQEAERLRLEQELEEERKSMAEKIRLEAEAEKQRVLAEQLEVQQREASKGLSEEEQKSVVEKHQAKLDQIEKDLEAETYRQQSAMEKKLALAKEKRMRAQAKKAAAELAAVSAAAETQNSELARKATDEVEAKQLAAVGDKLGGASVGAAAEQLVSSRHKKEAMALGARHMGDLAHRVAMAVGDMEEKQKTDLADLDESLASAPQHEKEERMAALKAQQAADLKNLEEETARSIAEEHQREVAEMQARHAAELASASSGIGMTAAQTAATLASSATVDDGTEILDMRSRLEDEKAKLLDQMKAEQEDLEAKLNEKHQAEIRRMEEEMNVERERERERAEKARAELEAAKEKMRQGIEEQQKAELDQLAASGQLEEHQKDQIMQKHKAEQERLAAAMEENRTRQADALQRILDERRTMRQRARVKNLESKLADEMAKSSPTARLQSIFRQQSMSSSSKSPVDEDTKKRVLVDAMVPHTVVVQRRVGRLANRWKVKALAGKKLNASGNGTTDENSQVSTPVAVAAMSAPVAAPTPATPPSISPVKPLPSPVITPLASATAVPPSVIPEMTQKIPAATPQLANQMAVRLGDASELNAETLSRALRETPLFDKMQRLERLVTLLVSRSGQP